MLKGISGFAVVFSCLIIASARSERNCKIPEVPKHGSVEVPEEPKTGTLAYYSCDVDATLVGESILTCLPSGEWSFDAPKCFRSCYVSEIEDGHLGKYEWKNQFSRRDFIYLQIGKIIKHLEKVTVLCKDEYIAGNKEFGRSQEVECNDGSWSELLYCRPKVSCEMPKVPKHGFVQLSDKLKVGTLAFFSCNEGAMLVGISTTKCLPSGKWSFDPPTCLISCRTSPPVAENAAVTAINDEQGGKVTYQCDEDFAKFKNETVFCDFGVWKGDLPICKKKEVQPENCIVSALQHGDMTEKFGDNYWNWRTFRYDRSYVKISTGTVVRHNTPLILVCHTGYLFQGTSTKDQRITCFNGQWNPDPVCLPQNCTVSALQNGDMTEKYGDYYWNWRTFRYERFYVKISTGTLVPHNTSLISVCHTGYSFQGTSTKDKRITCFNGQWKPDPVCLRQKCEITDVENGELGRYKRKSSTRGQFVPISNGTVAPHNTSLILVCHTGYSFKGTSTKDQRITCFNGLWSPDPVCLLRNCTVPILQHGDMKEQKIGDYYWSWRKIRYERNVTYKKLPEGTVLANNQSVTLFCPTQYSFQGTSLRNKKITCIGGLWKPDPVCVHDVKKDVSKIQLKKP